MIIKFIFKKMSHEKDKNYKKEEIDIIDSPIKNNIENDEKYISLSLKYDKLSRDYNNIEKKLNRTIQINKDNYSKMEQHYTEIIKKML